MKRRTFIAGIGSAAVWPLAAGAQQAERIRRIGMLLALDENDPLAMPFLSAFTRRLSQSGWTVGRNLQIDFRGGLSDDERAQVAAAELLRSAPDVVVAGGPTAARAMQQLTRTVPIVFTSISEPVAQGFVQSLARPGGNITGFTNLEPTVGAKWVELLRTSRPISATIMVAAVAA
jgi:putative tryptophan/tyrosine transport system substrate-binding protein